VFYEANSTAWKKMVGGQKFALDTELQSVVLRWLRQQPALHREFRSLVTNGTNV